MSELDLSEWIEMCLHKISPHAEEFIDGVREYEERIRKLEAQLRKSALQELSLLGQEIEVTAELEQAEAKIVELEVKLARAVEEKLDAIDTLDAWFDRRKLAHDAVDQAVVDAASGYLRTSRVGGMSQEESDLVLGVIQDMARLGVFADLFARTTLAELKGQDDE